jgi:hypothetical protein
MVHAFVCGPEGEEVVNVQRDKAYYQVNMKG